MESTGKRCPACHSKLRRRRGQPIVLGETSRLDLQATLLVDRQNRKRLERGHWNAERPAPMPETFARAEAAPNASPVAFVEPELAPLPEPEVLFTAPEPEAAVVEPEAVFLEPEVVVEPEPEMPEPEMPEPEMPEPEMPEPEMIVEEPEPELELEVLFDESEPMLEPYPFFEPVAEDAYESAPEPAASPSFLDLALAEHVRKAAAPTISETELDAALDGDDVNSVVDALHRKARGEQTEVQVEVPPVQLFEDPELPSRSLRLMAPPSSNRRRWNIDFKSRRGDDI